MSQKGLELPILATCSVWQNQKRESDHPRAAVYSVYRAHPQFVDPSWLHDNSTQESVFIILDEMQPVRCIEQPGKAKFITPFGGVQIDICEA